MTRFLGTQLYFIMVETILIKMKIKQHVNRKKLQIEDWGRPGLEPGTSQLPVEDSNH